MNRMATLLTFFLMACQASATVEDSSFGSSNSLGGTWTNPASPSLPTYLPGPCQGDSGSLSVNIALPGPEAETDKSYTTQGKPLDFIITVKNDGMTESNAEIYINPESCFVDWFSWTSTTMTIPARASRSLTLQVQPDINAVAGLYAFAVEATAECRRASLTEAKFRVQAYDYASETIVSGTGQFQINKDMRSMKSGIKSNKNVVFSGSVDALMKNEYLVDQAKGKNANFQEEDAVDNYNAVELGDALIGSENFKSSAVFGGVGAKVLESYDLQQMEFKSQDFSLHQTGSLKKTAEFKTLDNFTGEYLIDAKQSIPGQRSQKEYEFYNGSFEISRRILFRDATISKTPCSDSDCTKATGTSTKIASIPAFASPCLSISCNSFANRLNAFT
jgi:hypothetical protein